MYAAYFTLIVPFVLYILISSVYNVREDLELEFSALGGLFANIQVYFNFFWQSCELWINFYYQVLVKITILIKNRKQLRDLKSFVTKKVLLTGLESEIYKHYNRIVKYLISLMLTSFILAATLLILFPLFSSNEYFMPIVLMLPQTRYVSLIIQHSLLLSYSSIYFCMLNSYYGYPDFEINYIFSSYCCYMGAFFFIGKYFH